MGLSDFRIKNNRAFVLVESVSVLKSVFTAQYREFLKALVEARKAASITQQDLADLLGKPQSFVSKYERGERRLDVVEFLSVARAIGTDPYKLLQEIDPNAPDWFIGIFMKIKQIETLIHCGSFSDSEEWQQSGTVQ